MIFNNIYKDKTILITGHTGFKGSWLSIWLHKMGAKVVGYALDPYANRGNFEASKLGEKIVADIRGDIRDEQHLNSTIEKYKPEIIFHLAAQALVKRAYSEPKLTYETNLIGSLNILECVKKSDSVKTVVMITSDKCYENIEQIWGYKETDAMGGYDPYSSSKGCAELMIASYRNSYFHPKNYNKHGKSVASVRAGNVIGGGDWSEHRLIPDCIKCIEENKDIVIRNPKATRPWEHVLEPVSGYLRVAQKMMEDPISYATSFNFGPPIESNKTVWEVAQILADYYGKAKVVDVSIPSEEHENTLLNLDVTKAYVMLNWQARWGLKQTIEKTVDWYKESLHSSDMYDFSVQQIEQYRNAKICG